uniref:Signal recognition particle 19 kDa protein n=1 Tax=Castor canadensis TaxID=51338 RepID=A0A8C0X679_CASCN
MACAAARSPADQDRFICIYPAYLNNKKTIAEGRRIPISKAVENPTATEIQDVCSAVGLNVFLEVLHHTVHLGLVLQEEGPDDTLVEQLSPIRRTWGHTPQQEATLCEQSSTGKREGPTATLRTGVSSSIFSNSISSVFCRLMVDFSQVEKT